MIQQRAMKKDKPRRTVSKTKVVLSKTAMTGLRGFIFELNDLSAQTKELAVLSYAWMNFSDVYEADVTCTV